MINKTNIMLAGGKGERFRQEYTDPKPLIPVDGEPMVLKAAASFPDASQNIFLCLQEHIDTYHIDEKIKQQIPSAEIIPIAQVTQGQASTCLLAKDFVNPNNAITIGSCDNGMVYDREKFEKLLMDENTDAIIWTFRNNPNVKRKPEAWGWVKVNEHGLVQEVSVKIPISDTPMNDHAVVGWFSFKNEAICFTEIEDMIKKDIRINNEFYLDKLADLMAKKGYKVRVFEIDTYVGWGTPADLQTYQKWEAYFKNQNKKEQINDTIDQEELTYWKKYFS
jgi:dTDP-glucose pyrophosphorylase